MRKGVGVCVAQVLYCRMELVFAGKEQCIALHPLSVPTLAWLLAADKEGFVLHGRAPNHCCLGQK